LALVALAVLGAFDAVAMLPAAYQYLGRTREAGRRLMEITNTPPAVRFADASPELPLRCAVAFEAVHFRYRPADPPALAALTFRVEPGERVAVVGRTGAGKSTLAHLLVRFWDPGQGCVRIGGRDIRTLAEGDLRRLVTVVSQQPHIFNASIRDNLRIAAPEAAEGDLQAALAAVQLDAFTASLSDGLDTWVGEAGRRLSGGQARRLALARAVLHDGPVWVLDEPTEGLDRVTEARTLQRLFSLTSGRTVLLITHRLVDLDRMDRILVMENGHIVEQGSQRELLNGATRYAAMHARLRL
jgi:ATP-binding cassette subfamily C protein CydC